MKNLLRTSSIFVLFIALFASCEKVIEVDLNSASPQIIVEATMSDSLSETAEVRLTRSVNFSETNVFPAITKADVTILDLKDNKVDTLKETTAGVYKSAKLVGKVGHSYQLTVKTEGKTLTAKTTVQRKVNLDNIEIRSQAFFGSLVYQVIPKFVDPKGTGDNYRFILSVNGKRKNDVFVFNDELSDGNVNGRPLNTGRSSDSTENIRLGDRIDIEFQCIDKGVYDYFNTLGVSANNPGFGGTSPSNPISNIQGGALGYFAAYTKQTKSVVVK
jgi:Domain of unknown function (DUF4249)